MNLIEIATELIEKDGLNKRNRKREVIYRKIFLQYHLRKSGMIYQAIADMFNQDHASVIHNVKVHEDLMQYNYDDYFRYIEEYKSILTNVKLELPKRNIYADIANASTIYHLRTIKRYLKEKKYDSNATYLEE